MCFFLYLRHTFITGRYPNIFIWFLPINNNTLVDYKRQESENTLISIGYNSKVYSKERLYDIYFKYHSKAVFTPEGLAEVYKEFYRDVVIKCTVTFNNGKTATKEITVSENQKLMKMVMAV